MCTYPSILLAQYSLCNENKLTKIISKSTEAHLIERKYCNQFCKGCPIGHICVTPVIINCSCLRVFTKVFGAPPLRPLNKHQLEKFIVSNLHSFSTFMGSYSALAWPCLTGRVHTGSVIQQQLLGEHYTLDQTWIMGSLQ